jgi:hypothetical protein
LCFFRAFYFFDTTFDTINLNKEVIVVLLNIKIRAIADQNSQFDQLGFLNQGGVIELIPKYIQEWTIERNKFVLRKSYTMNR